MTTGKAAQAAFAAQLHDEAAGVRLGGTETAVLCSTGSPDGSSDRPTRRTTVDLEKVRRHRTARAL